ncbi:MAG: hypothetical protein AB8G05_15690 [Oligoflexales bacterium]
MSRHILNFLALLHFCALWNTDAFAFKDFFGNWRLVCQEPSADSLDDKGKIYSFESMIICEISGNQGAIENLVPGIIRWLDYNPDFNIRKKILLDDENGRLSYQLEFLETRDSGHGIMKILSDSMLVTKDSKFLFSSVSRSIKASGSAKHTVSETFEVALKKKYGGSFEVKVSKFVKINKPTMAPKSIFMRKVIREMTKDIDLTANKYVKLLASYL